MPFRLWGYIGWVRGSVSSVGDVLLSALICVICGFVVGLAGASRLRAFVVGRRWTHDVRGVGRALEGALEAFCRPKDVHRLLIATTNDNIPGLYFYQRLGYRLKSLAPGEAEAAMADHGAPGARGFGGIPIRDELVLVKELTRHPGGD